ncbi:hypothetical protein ACHAW5_009228 [Stephanodiscus triporus]|uniref:PhoD-like phosphatase metallophosphatase domain-containing protein n=1 Tax=Stephanodiscus triporus TaxID=2934178 RepID=A0ABD3PNG1_9STRA
MADADSSFSIDPEAEAFAALVGGPPSSSEEGEGSFELSPGGEEYLLSPGGGEDSLLSLSTISGPEYIVKSLPQEEVDEGGEDRVAGGGGGGGGVAPPSSGERKDGGGGTTTATIDDDDDGGGGGGSPPPDAASPSAPGKTGSSGGCWSGFKSKCGEGGGYNILTYVILLSSFAVLVFVYSVISTHLSYNRVAYRDWALAGGGEFLFFFFVVALTMMPRFGHEYPPLAERLIHRTAPSVHPNEVTSTSATFRVRGPSADDGNRREFVVSTNPNLAIESDQIVNVPVAYGDFAPDEHGMKALSVESLAPRTPYYYGITRPQRTANSAVVAGDVGFFVTPAPEGSRMDFTIATGSCSYTGSKSETFSDVLSLNPLMFIHMGDLHYEDLNTLDIDERLGAYDRVMGSPSQRLLYMRTIFSYMWDDHDWLGNNQDSEDEGAAIVAKLAYNLAIPNYPLGSSSALAANAAKYQAFTIGTVRFIVTDLRSESFRSTEYYPGKIYSTEQKEWLFNELAQAANYDFVVWVTTRPWTEPVKIGSDSWGGFASDRDELSAYIAATVGAGPRNLLVLSGDNHMVAFDDGSSTDFSGQDVNPGGFPLLHSGPLAKYGPGATDFFKPEKYYFTDGCMAYSSEVNHQFSTVDFSFPSDVNQLGCMRIRSYSGDASNIIFEKELCGEIMKYGAPDQETCTIKRMTVPTWSIFTAAAGLVVLGGILSSWKLGRQRITLALSFFGLGILYYVLTVGAAIAGALCFGTLGVNMFAVSIWVLAEAFVGSIFVIMAINEHCSSTFHDSKIAEKGTFDEESAVKAIYNDDNDEERAKHAKNKKNIDEEADVPTIERIVQPVEGAMGASVGGGDDPAGSDMRNVSIESSVHILNDLALTATNMYGLATGDCNTQQRQITDDPDSSEVREVSTATNNSHENTDLIAAKATKRDSSIVRKMKQTLVGSGSKEINDVAAPDTLKIDLEKEAPIITPYENGIAPYSAGLDACGLNQPFEEGVASVLSSATNMKNSFTAAFSNFLSMGNAEEKKTPASPGESYFRLADDRDTNDNMEDETVKQEIEVTNPTSIGNDFRVSPSLIPL